MAANTRVDIARSDVVGSLLRPAYLREARQGMRQGRVSEAELQEHTVVAGLVTTKNPMLENAAAVEARLREATQRIPLERLAVSP